MLSVSAVGLEPFRCMGATRGGGLAGRLYDLRRWRRRDLIVTSRFGYKSFLSQQEEIGTWKAGGRSLSQKKTEKARLESPFRMGEDLGRVTTAWYTAKQTVCYLRLFKLSYC